VLNFDHHEDTEVENTEVEDTESLSKCQVIHLGEDDQASGYRRKVINEMKRFASFEVCLHNFSEITFSLLYKMKTKFPDKFSKTISFELGQQFSKGQIDVLYSIIRDK
jgi:hypothetical protein